MHGGHASPGALLGVVTAFTVVANLATALRLFVRLVIKRTAGIDDATISVAMALSIALTTTLCVSVKHGVGQHFDTLSEEERMASLHWMWASIWVYYLALGATKMSILLQYLRIFPYDKFRIACYALCGIIAVYTCWTFFSAVFACVPVASFWNTNIHGTCLNRLAVWFTNAAVNILTDIATAVLPLPLLKGLELPNRQKYALMVVFGLAGSTCVISILRLQSLYAISESTDPTWDNPMAAIYSSTEVNVGILCSCLPTLKGGISYFFPRLFPDRSNRSGHEMRDVAPAPLSGPSKSFSGKEAQRSRQTWSPDDERDPRHYSGEEGAIQVVTVLEQEVGSGSTRADPFPWESESMRNLVPSTPSQGV